MEGFFFADNRFYSLIRLNAYETGRKQQRKSMKDALAEHSRARPELSRRRTNASAARSVWNVLFVEFVFCCCTFFVRGSADISWNGPCWYFALRAWTWKFLLILVAAVNYDFFWFVLRYKLKWFFFRIKMMSNLEIKTSDWRTRSASDQLDDRFVSQMQCKTK